MEDASSQDPRGLQAVSVLSVTHDQDPEGSESEHEEDAVQGTFDACERKSDVQDGDCDHGEVTGVKLVGRGGSMQRDLNDS